LIISNNFNRVLQSRSKENLIGQPHILYILKTWLQSTVEINPKAIFCGVLFMKDVIHYKIFENHIGVEIIKTTERWGGSESVVSVLKQS
jgi:hypothetical protein